MVPLILIIITLSTIYSMIKYRLQLHGLLLAEIIVITYTGSLRILQPKAGWRPHLVIGLEALLLVITNILSIVVLGTSSHPSYNPLYSAISVSIYGSIIALFMLALIDSSDTLKNILLVFSLFAAVYSSLYYYDGDIISIFANPGHLAIIVSAIALLFGGGPVSALTGLLGASVASSLDAGGYTYMDTLGFTRILWIQLLIVVILFWIMRNIRIIKLNNVDKYTLPVSVLASLFSIIYVVTRDYTDLAYISKYLWILLPLAVLLTALYMSAESKTRYMITIIGSTLLAFVMYKYAPDIVFGLDGTVIGLFTFTLLILLSNSYKALASSTLVLFLMLYTAATFVPVTATYDSFTLNAPLNAPITVSSIKGNTATVYLGEVKVEGDQITVPVRIYLDINDTSVSASTVLTYEINHPGWTSVSLRTVNPPHITDINIEADESIISYVVTSQIFSEQPPKTTLTTVRISVRSFTNIGPAIVISYASILAAVLTFKTLSRLEVKRHGI